MYGYKPCPDCGAAVQRATLQAGSHECNEERYIAHQAMIAKQGLERLENDLELWLGTNLGMFQQFLAERLCHDNNN